MCTYNSYGFSILLLKPKKALDILNLALVLLYIKLYSPACFKIELLLSIEVIKPYHFETPTVSNEITKNRICSSDLAISFSNNSSASMVVQVIFKTLLNVKFINVFTDNYFTSLLFFK